MVEQAHGNKTKHAWIGKRGLSGSPFGSSFSPGMDAYHWAIVIDGWIYEIQNENGKWKVKMDDWINSSRGRDFDWYRINAGCVVKSRDELRNYAYRLEGTKYGHALGTTRSKGNCQEFCALMLAFAMDVSMGKAQSMIVGHVGTALF